MASTNPGNFANRDKEEVSDIASMVSLLTALALKK